MKKKKEDEVAFIRPLQGEPCRFQVKSLSCPQEWHMVDLAAYQGQGCCDCIRFDTVCRPRIIKTGTLPPGMRCRHIRSARELALNLTIKQFIEEHPQ